MSLVYQIQILSVFFLFSFFFSILWFVTLSKFSIYWAFISRIHNIKTNFPNFFQKKFSHSTKIHPKKPLFYTEFLLFFDSRFICYDCPCDFSFPPQAAPIIATGQGEPAPTLVHSPSWGRHLRGCLYRFRDSGFI